MKTDEYGLLVPEKLKSRRRHYIDIQWTSAPLFGLIFPISLAIHSSYLPLLLIVSLRGNTCETLSEREKNTHNPALSHRYNALPNAQFSIAFIMPCWRKNVVNENYAHTHTETLLFLHFFCFAPSVVELKLNTSKGARSKKPECCVYLY